MSPTHLKTEGKRPRGRPRSGWWYNNEIVLKRKTTSECAMNSLGSWQSTGTGSCWVVTNFWGTQTREVPELGYKFPEYLHRTCYTVHKAVHYIVPGFATFLAKLG